LYFHFKLKGGEMVSLLVPVCVRSLNPLSQSSERRGEGKSSKGSKKRKRSKRREDNLVDLKSFSFFLSIFFTPEVLNGS